MAKLSSHKIIRNGTAMYPRVRMSISFGSALQGGPGDLKTVQS
jgi:hypothetical protein